MLMGRLFFVMDETMSQHNNSKKLQRQQRCNGLGQYHEKELDEMLGGCNNETIASWDN